MKKVFFILIISIMLFSLISFAESKEIIEKRSFTSKTYRTNDGNYKKVLSVQPMHYRDASGQFVNIPDDENRDKYLQIAYEQMYTPVRSLAKMTQQTIHTKYGGYHKYTYQKINTVNGTDTTWFSEQTEYGFSDDLTIGKEILPTYLHPYDTCTYKDIYLFLDSVKINSGNSRALLSWSTSGFGISENGTINVDSIKLRINYTTAAVASGHHFYVQYRSMGYLVLNRDPELSHYNSIASGNLITTEDLGYVASVRYTDSTIAVYSSGAFFDDFLDCWENENPYYTIGFKHSTEDYSSYGESESKNCWLDGGYITICYTVHEVKLANQRVNSSTDLTGTLSLDNISGHTGTDYTNESSGTSVPVYDGDSYTVKTHNEWLTSGADSVKHINWNETTSDYKMIKSNFPMENDVGELAAKFDTTSEITLSSGAGELEIRDPWYVTPGTSNQPNTYREISPGTYKVFLDQDIQGSVYYSLRAPKRYVTTSDIMVFDKWAATPSSSVLFGDSTSRTTAVKFNSSVSTITAQYVSANTNGRTVTVSAGETLTIPTGATYNITPGNFMIDVWGTLSINLSTSQQVTFQSNAGTPTNADWWGILIRDATVVMQNVTIKNAENSLYIYGNSTSSTKYINNCTIEDCENGIELYQANYDESVNLNSSITIKNNVIYDIGDANNQNPGILIQANLKTVKIDSNEIYNCYGGIYASFDFTSTQVSTYTIPSEILFSHNIIHDLLSDNNPASGIKIIDGSTKSSPYTLPYGKIVNNTIDAIDGYGIYIDRDENGLWYVKNTIVTEIGEHNSAAGYAVYSSGYTLPVQYCAFYSVEETTSGCSTSNLVLDNPDYVSASDYHLQTGSPCIDTGDPDTDDDSSEWENDADDRDPDGTRIDIGAFYCDYPPSIPGGFNGVWYNNHPKVYWTAVSDPDLDYYEVWKRRDSVWSLRTTTTSTNYVDNSETKWTRPLIMETIYYRVRSVDEGDNSSSYTSTESFMVNNVECDKRQFFPVVEIDPIPTEFMLHPVYPNPFNITTTLKLDLPEEARFSLIIYDINGSEVWRLNNKRTNTYPPGYHTILWEGRNNFGLVVPTGVYFIVYNSPEHKLTQKVVLMK